MTTVIFVHGTGGRQTAYAKTFWHIERSLRSRRSDINVLACLWGDTLGAKLNANGASIPIYRESEGGKPLTSEEREVVLWKELYKNPLYEMELIATRPLPSSQGRSPGQLTPTQTLKGRVEALPTDAALHSKLTALGIESVFPQAYEKVTGATSMPFSQMLETAPQVLDGDYLVIARAIVAAALFLCKQQDIHPWLLENRHIRDQAIRGIEQSLSRGEASRGVISDWTKALSKRVSSFPLDIGTNHIQRKRGAIMDGAYPFAGDILVYQAKGQRIRDLIRSQIEHEDVKPPVILLAHSLGGIACVDLLIESDLQDKVQRLITVGSQAPFFYEIDALQTLPYGESLPEHFPRWLNIYDPRDFLSYVGDREGLFPGKITDVEVNNQEPFPEAHGAYWANEQTWTEIEKVLP